MMLTKSELIDLQLLKQSHTVLSVASRMLTQDAFFTMLLSSKTSNQINRRSAWLDRVDLLYWAVNWLVGVITLWSDCTRESIFRWVSKVFQLTGRTLETFEVIAQRLISYKLIKVRTSPAAVLVCWFSSEWWNRFQQRIHLPFIQR